MENDLSAYKGYYKVHKCMFLKTSTFGMQQKSWIPGDFESNHFYLKKRKIKKMSF